MPCHAAVVPFDPRKRLVLVACVLGSAVVFLDTTVVNVALPALGADLDAGLATQQWVVEAYLLTLGSLLLVGGSLGDLLGRRRVYTAGLVAFGVTSVACAVAPSAGPLVAARALQGVAGALLVPSSLAIISSVFSEDERGRAIGLWTAWTGVSILLGPPVGGLLVDEISWRMVFAMNVPLVAVTMWLVARAVPVVPPVGNARSIDVLGATLCTLGLGGPVFALIEQPTRGFGDPLVAVPLVLGLVALGLFVAHERRATHPMMPLSLFGSHNFAAANLATLCFYAGLLAMTFFVALFLQQVAGYSAFQSGLALMPTSIVMFFLSPRFGALGDRVGTRALMAAGPAIASLGLGLMLWGLERDLVYVTDLLPGVLVFGLGLSMTVAPLTTTALAAVAPERAGVASGVNNAVARIAGLVSIAVVGAVVSAGFGARLEQRLATVPLSAPARAALVEASERPLAGTAPPELDRAERARVEPALAEASEAGVHLGLGLAAALMAAAGLTAALGVRDPARAPQPSSAPVPTQESAVP
jgi:EmrB/QacA subfamily drug resistance transporter